MNVLVGSAWPYANEDLHIGQIAAWLPADVIARYHRAKGDNVYYVSGTDCHGEIVALQAEKEGCRPQEISDCYHAKFKQWFRKMGFSFDCYTKTSFVEHKEFVRDFHRRLYRSPYVYEKDTLDGEGKQMYISLSQLRNQLKNLVNTHPQWGENVISVSKEQVEQGLTDMPLTTNLEWGIDVPHLGFEDKRIYVWAENVLGYLSASKICAERRGEEFTNLWGQDAKHYYVYGKENIYFHTMLLPGMLAAHGEGYKLPDQMVAAEPVLIDGIEMADAGEKIVWIKDLLKTYQTDSIRYYFLKEGPQDRAFEFSEQELLRCHNTDLVDIYGAYVHRIIEFVEQYYDKKVPEGTLDSNLAERIDIIYEKVGEYIEKGQCREALEKIFTEIERENKYLDKHDPWTMVENEPVQCANTLYNSLQVMVNIAVMLAPFLPNSSEKMINELSLQNHWDFQIVEPGFYIGNLSNLYKKME